MFLGGFCFIVYKFFDIVVHFYFFSLSRFYPCLIQVSVVCPLESGYDLERCNLRQNVVRTCHFMYSIRIITHKTAMDIILYTVGCYCCGYYILSKYTFLVHKVKKYKVSRTPDNQDNIHVVLMSLQNSPYAKAIPPYSIKNLHKLHFYQLV